MFVAVLTANGLVAIFRVGEREGVEVSRLIHQAL
jgi:hypothetical protein